MRLYKWIGFIYLIDDHADFAAVSINEDHRMNKQGLRPVLKP